MQFDVMLWAHAYELCNWVHSSLGNNYSEHASVWTGLADGGKADRHQPAFKERQAVKRLWMAVLQQVYDAWLRDACLDASLRSRQPLKQQHCFSKLSDWWVLPPFLQAAHSLKAAADCTRNLGSAAAKSCLTMTPFRHKFRHCTVDCSMHFTIRSVCRSSPSP